MTWRNTGRTLLGAWDANVAVRRNLITSPMVGKRETLLKEHDIIEWERWVLGRDSCFHETTKIDSSIITCSYYISLIASFATMWR
jgi:hypothetical protein